MENQNITIVHTINKKNYVLINYFIYSMSGVTIMQHRAKKFECILQGITWKWNLFRQYRVAHLLVPEENIIDFNNEILAE